MLAIKECTDALGTKGKVLPSLWISMRVSCLRSSLMPALTALTKNIMNLAHVLVYLSQVAFEKRKISVLYRGICSLMRTFRLWQTKWLGDQSILLWTLELFQVQGVCLSQ